MGKDLWTDPGLFVHKLELVGAMLLQWVTYLIGVF
jgi:hypothetical protein